MIRAIKRTVRRKKGMEIREGTKRWRRVEGLALTFSGGLIDGGNLMFGESFGVEGFLHRFGVSRKKGYEEEYVRDQRKQIKILRD